MRDLSETLPASRHASSSRRLRLTLAALLLGSTVIGGGIAPLRGIPPAAAAETAQKLPDFSDLVARVRGAVVSITTRIKAEPAAVQGPLPFPLPFPFRMGPNGIPQLAPPQVVEARGSGFIIDPSGIIVTNNHVVKDAKEVTVTFDDGTEKRARVLGRDPRTDIAVLKVKADHPLPAVSLGDSSTVKPGQWVIAMGNPFGLGGTVTAGIVSAKGRDIGEGPYDNFIQIDAPINQGNSGGPLFNQDGEVIGMNTAILSPSGGSIGIGFSIPSNLIKSVVAELETTGHVTRGYLGVAAQPIGPGMDEALGLPADQKGKGALVASVEPHSPAAAAGIEPGDVITAVNDQKVADPRDLARDIGALKPGSKAEITLWRNGESLKKTVTLAALPEATGGEEHEGGGAESGHIGVALQPLTPDLREQLGLPPHLKGAVVANVEMGSAAEAAGLQPGDVIVGVGATPVDGPEAAVAAIRKALAAHHAVALRVWRDGQTTFIAIDLDKKPDDAG
jgi:serine protease Do